MRKFTKDEAKAIVEKAIAEYETLTESEACSDGRRLSTKAIYKALGVEAPAPEKIGRVEFCVKYWIIDDDGHEEVHYSPTGAKKEMENADCFYVEGQYAWNDLTGRAQLDMIMEKLKETADKYVINDMVMKTESEA